jgi:phage/plasmid-like protein (TIGR03299 family)
MLNDTPTIIPNRKAIVRSDNQHVLGMFKEGYAPHQYDEWLLGTVGNLLDDNLIIGSAGLLREGAVAWVQVEMPENFRAGDVEFRPNLIATTSFDGSIATTFKRTSTIVVCDNTRTMALAENSETVKVRHSSQSMTRLADARDALGIVMTLADDFQHEIEAMLAQTVSDIQFGTLVERFVPLTAVDSKHKATRVAATRDQMWEMWRNDPRCSPWKNTGFGVMQVANTWRQHERPTRGGTVKMERTMMEALKGQTDTADYRVAQLLAAL